MAEDIFITVFLRGGYDGLNLVGPAGDTIYQTERRPETRVARDGDHPGLVIANHFADSDFRLHYKAGPLKNLYDQKQLAIVHACGLTNGTRSHFEAQNYMERGTPENKTLTSGWLARLAQVQQLQGITPVIASSNSLPLSLLACSEAVAVPNAKKVSLQGGNDHFRSLRANLLQNSYQGMDPIQRNGAHVLEMLTIYDKHLPKDAQGKLQDYKPADDAHYTGDEFGNSMKSIAQLIKMDVGLRIATADYGGWDTHVGQGGRFANLVDNLSRTLEAFWADMKAYQDRITLVVMSEFGRRLKSNDSGGTDHGHGNAMLVLGGQVKGGEIYGKWPGLANEQLDNQVDLAVTTDFRTVLTELAGHRIGSHLNTVFPGFTGYKPLGIMRA